MLLVGNDVVDLVDQEKKAASRNIRFIDRVFTPAEQGMICASADPGETLWILWAAKEAAYKVVRKSQPSVCSIPRSYQVHLDRSGRPYPVAGTVITPAGIVHFRCFADDETVHTIAASRQDRENQIIWGVERLDDGHRPAVSETEDPSVLVRQALMQRLSEVLGCRASAMEVRRFKEPRGLAPPRLYIHGAPANVDISLSHDGRVVAYAFSLC